MNKIIFTTIAMFLMISAQFSNAQSISYPMFKNGVWNTVTVDSLACVKTKKGEMYGFEVAHLWQDFYKNQTIIDTTTTNQVENSPTPQGVKIRVAKNLFSPDVKGNVLEFEYVEVWPLRLVTSTNGKKMYAYEAYRLQKSDPNIVFLIMQKEAGSKDWLINTN